MMEKKLVEKRESLYSYTQNGGLLRECLGYIRLQFLKMDSSDCFSDINSAYTLAINYCNILHDYGVVSGGKFLLLNRIIDSAFMNAACREDVRL